MSRHRGECPVTIVVGISPNDQNDWVSLRQTIVGILDAWGLQMVGILIRWDGVWSGARGAAEDETLQSAAAGTAARSIDSVAAITPGTILKPRKMKSGTAIFGGWVEIRSPGGRWRLAGLTCTHCVLPPEADISVNKATGLWTTRGVALGDARAAILLSVDVPTEEFIRTQVLHHQARIIDQVEESRYKELKTLADIGIPLGRTDRFVWANFTNEVTKHQRSLDTYKVMLQTGEYVFGHVLAASGLRTIDPTFHIDPRRRAYYDGNPFNMDWALVVPRGNPLASNTVPVGTPNYSMLPPNYTLKRFELDDLKPNDTLYKVGAVTGARRDQSKPSSLGSTASWLRARSLLLQIAGDAGSLVATAGGAVAGLLFGANDASSFAFFTLATELIKDIKGRTGLVDVRIMPP
ncbi:hypothetical protein BJX64DRAFT_295326 [Aspergillus heterothallicus]